MSLARSAEKLFNLPRLYRAKFAVTGAVVAVVRPVMFREFLTVDATIAAAAIPPGANVCEIGCGDGENYRIVERLAGGVRYTGIDINAAMVAHCSDAFPQQRWIKTVPPYPFADDTFDYCLIVNVLHHLNSVDDILAMLREAARIARTVVLFEPLQSETKALHALKTLYWRLTDGGYRYNRLAEFHELFAAAGLQLTWERYTAPLRHFYGARLARQV